jgi:hypothetical protein
LNEAELLPTIAEVGVAIAGFASLISVLGVRRRSEQLAASFSRIRGMLETSLLTAAFAFAPFIPFKFGVSSAISWRAAGVVFALAAFSRIVLIRSRFQPHQTVSRVSVYGIGGAQAVAALILLAAALVLSETRVVGAYHLLLFVSLLSSIYLFMRVAVSIISADEPAAQQAVEPD